MSNLKIENLTQVQADFNNYKNSVNKSHRATIHKYLMLIRNSARGILWNNVIKWTGNLASKVTITKEGSLEGEVVADEVYANWIEVGGRGGFEGYHYMEGALDKHEQAFLEAIEKNLRV